MSRFLIFFVIAMFSCGYLWGAGTVAQHFLSGLVCSMIPLSPLIGVAVLKRTGHWEHLENRFLGLE